MSKDEKSKDESTNKKVIDLTLDNGYEVFLDNFENGGQLGNKSIHTDLYKKGLDIILEIKKNSKVGQAHKNENMINVILFSGERGTGKSSAMNSFSALIQDNKNIRKFLDKGEKETTCFDNLLFSEIDNIDPTLLNANDSIVETVIAKLFDKYLEKVKESPKNITDEKTRTMLTKFKDIYGHLKTTYEDKKDRYKVDVYTENTIETIKRLGASYNLKKELKEVVSEYLDQTTDTKDCEKFLVIKIDDLDMNISYAYNMLEEIRKYLSLPNVIILLATFEGQLIDVLKNKFTEQITGKIGSLNGVDPETTENREKIQIMAEKYLTKLFPVEYRLYLANIEDMFTKNLIHVKVEKSKTDSNTEEIEAQQFILKMIYEKTRLIFLTDKYGKNFLVPSNLREYIHLAHFLISLDDVVGLDTVVSGDVKDIYDEKKREVILKNLMAFKKYFIYGMAKNKFTYKEYKLIENIFVKNADKLNDYVLDFLKSYKPLDLLTQEKGSEKGIGNIIDAIENAKTKNTDNREMIFFDAIYASYSIRILELIIYNEIPNFKQILLNRTDDFNLPLYDIFGENIFGKSNSHFLRSVKGTKSDRASFEVKGFYYNGFKINNEVVNFRKLLNNEYFEDVIVKENSSSIVNNNESNTQNDENQNIHKIIYLFTIFLKYSTSDIETLAQLPDKLGREMNVRFNITNPFYYSLYKDFSFYRTNTKFKEEKYSAENPKHYEHDDNWSPINNADKILCTFNDLSESLFKKEETNTNLFFPIYSIDFINQIRVFYKENVKSEAPNLFDHVQSFFKDFGKTIEYIIITNKHLVNSKIYELYDNNSIVKYIAHEKSDEYENKYTNFFEENNFSLSNMLNELFDKYEHDKQMEKEKDVNTVKFKLAGGGTIGVMQTIKNKINENINLLTKEKTNYPNKSKLFDVYINDFKKLKDVVSNSDDTDEIRSIFRIEIEGLKQKFEKEKNSNDKVKLFDNSDNDINPTLKKWKFDIKKMISLYEIEKEKYPENSELYSLYIESYQQINKDIDTSTGEAESIEVIRNKLLELEKTKKNKNNED